MKRKFLTNLTLLIILNLLVKPFWVLGIDLTVQNTVGAAEYGFYFSLLSFSLLLNIVQEMGISNYNNREIARDQSRISNLLPNILVLKLILAVIYFTVSLAIALAIGYEWLQIRLLIVLLFNQFLHSLILYLRSNISGLQMFRTDSLLSVTDRLLMIIICSILLWGNVGGEVFRIEWFVYAQTAAYVITSVIITLIVLSNANFSKLAIDFPGILNMLRQSYPYALLGLLMILYYRTDSVMLERMLPDGMVQAGIYAQGFRILDAASMLGFLFAGILLPMFARMIKQKQPVGQLFSFSFRLLIVPSVTAAIALNFYRIEIMELLYRHHADEAAPIFGILMISFVFISISILSGTLLTANGSLRRLNMIAVFSVIMNIVLNILLIPGYQALGSAVASMATQLFTAILQVLMVQRIFRFRMITGQVVRFALFTGLLVLTALVAGVTDLPWVYGFLLICLAGVAFSFTLRLIKTREIMESLF